MDGILILAKPAGPTSHDMVALVRRLGATKRVGHGGTLDPFASGVLPLFLGRATRMLEYHLADPKAYRATVCFGASSTTDDLQGELTPSDGPAPGRAAVEATLTAFRGPIIQVPPAYSAVKVAGRHAYALARAGEKLELAPRQVTIDRLELVEWDGSDPDRPIAILEVECSAGTYVRALARDLGRELGTAAYLGMLSRTSSGPFRLADAHRLDEIRAAASTGADGLRPFLLRPDAGLEHLPAIELGPNDVAAVARGQFVSPAAAVPRIAAGDQLRLLDEEGRLVAMATLRGGRLAPEKVFIDAPRTGPAPELEAALLAERDPDERVDPDPASPDDV